MKLIEKIAAPGALIGAAKKMMKRNRARGLKAGAIAKPPPHAQNLADKLRPRSLTTAVSSQNPVGAAGSMLGR